MEYQIGTSVFDGWEIVRRIGSGASSVVYEIRKKGQEVAFSSALKVMRIPQDPSVIDFLHSEGKDNEGIASYLSGIVDELIDEIRIMVSMKGSPCIVSCEDYKKVYDPHSGQWEVLIRMELLQPLSEYQMEKDLTEADVHRLAVQISRALALLSEHGIIHRDIKPENIFVSEYGDFKIGDFGIAKVKEQAPGSLAKAGTENYMAPEVYLGRQYDHTVDIYSFGLILYKLLNKNRLPFYPVDKSCTAMEQQLALQSRMGGRKELPMPELASPEFGHIILKMCAFRPGDRYQNAGQLLAALESFTPSDEVVLLRQRSGAALTGSRKASSESDMTHAVFTGAPRLPEGNPAVKTAIVPGEDGSTADVPAFGIPQNDSTGNPGDPGISRSSSRIPDEASLKSDGRKAPSDQRPGYTPSLDDKKEDEPKRFDRKKIVIAVAALAIVLALVLPRLTAQEFTLTVNGGSGSGSYTSGTSISVSSETEAGQIFSEWEAEGIELSDTDRYADEITIKMPRKNVVLTAVCEVTGCTVTVNGGSGSGEYAYGDTVTAEADEPEEGYEFAGWGINSGSPSITDKSLQKVSFVIEGEDVELTAFYQQIDYQLTVNDGNGSGSYHLGDRVSISADSQKNGMTFSYWSIDSGSLELSDLTALNISFEMPAEDITMTAHYAIEKYTVKVTDGSGNGMYAVGDTVTVSAAAVNDQGIAFTSWTVTSGELDTSSLDLTQSELSFVMPQCDLVWQANYGTSQTEAAAAAETYVLSVNGGTGSGSYAPGEVISVSHDAPQSGMAFAYWFITGYPDSIDASADVLQITMPENDVTITAVFAQE